MTLHTCQKFVLSISSPSPSVPLAAHVHMHDTRPLVSAAAKKCSEVVNQVV